jgi:hypothetical protein
VARAQRRKALTRRARRLRITERTKAGAAVISAKARDLNEQYQIAEKTQALVADTRAAAGASWLLTLCRLRAWLTHVLFLPQRV